MDFENFKADTLHGLESNKHKIGEALNGLLQSSEYANATNGEKVAMVSAIILSISNAQTVAILEEYHRRVK